MLTPRRTAGALTALALAVTGVALAPFASAATGSHDPFGAVTHVQRTSSGVRFTGWAADPDARHDSATILVLRDGRIVSRDRTDIAMPGVARNHDLGGQPGFALTATVPADGQQHTLCIGVRNVGPGTTRLLHCTLAPSGAHSPDVIAAHSPVGHVQHARLAHGVLHLRGWTTDPDFRAGRSTVVLYVDGAAVRTVQTGSSDARQRDLGAGSVSGYRFTANVGGGAHIACVWTVNVGIGANALDGCRAVQAGHVGSGAVREPKANKRVVREALRHLGGKYVWGAEGPHHFDCSGLVQYSYRKAGRTVPRVAADQFAAARKIPAARAVPGDLVFYHDSLGHVYHVGIYLGPGNSVAAIDPAEGINYQTIWPDSGETYGSFTHR